MSGIGEFPIGRNVCGSVCGKNQREKKLTDFLNELIEYQNSYKNNYLMILLIGYNVGSVSIVRMPPFSDEKQPIFQGVEISATKNAFTLAKRPIRGFT